MSKQNTQTRRHETKQFVNRAITRSPDKVSIEEIVYLDEDLQTYKYFMTGDFDAEARERELQAQQTKNGDTEEDGSDKEQVEEPPDPSGGFYNKLVTLNEKIGVFQNQFYGRKPKRQITYEHLFKDKVKDFETFKLLYGYSEGGTRLIKIGNETLRVNN